MKFKLAATNLQSPFVALPPVMPSSATYATCVRDWLGHELESRGIDAVVYAHYVLNLLLQDEVDATDDAPVDVDIYCSNGRNRGKKDKACRCRLREKALGICECKNPSVPAAYSLEELKKSAAVECLMAVSEQKYGIAELVDELCERLKTFQVEVDQQEETLLSVSGVPDLTWTTDVQGKAKCVQQTLVAASVEDRVPESTCSNDNCSTKPSAGSALSLHDQVNSRDSNLGCLPASVTVVSVDDSNASVGSHRAFVLDVGSYERGSNVAIVGDSAIPELLDSGLPIAHQPLELGLFKCCSTSSLSPPYVKHKGRSDAPAFVVPKVVGNSGSASSIHDALSQQSGTRIPFFKRGNLVSAGERNVMGPKDDNLSKEPEQTDNDSWGSCPIESPDRAVSPLFTVNSWDTNHNLPISSTETKWSKIVGDNSKMGASRGDPLDFSIESPLSPVRGRGYHGDETQNLHISSDESSDDISIHDSAELFQQLAAKFNENLAAIWADLDDCKKNKTQKTEEAQKSESGKCHSSTVPKSDSITGLVGPPLSPDHVRKVWNVEHSFNQLRTTMEQPSLHRPSIDHPCLTKSLSENRDSFGAEIGKTGMTPLVNEVCRIWAVDSTASGCTPLSPVFDSTRCSPYTESLDLVDNDLRLILEMIGSLSTDESSVGEVTVSVSGPMESWDSVGAPRSDERDLFSPYPDSSKDMCDPFGLKRGSIWSQPRSEDASLLDENAVQSGPSSDFSAPFGSLLPLDVFDGIEDKDVKELKELLATFRCASASETGDLEILNVGSPSRHSAKLIDELISSCCASDTGFTPTNDTALPPRTLQESPCTLANHEKRSRFITVKPGGSVFHARPFSRGFLDRACEMDPSFASFLASFETSAPLSVCNPMYGVDPSAMLGFTAESGPEENLLESSRTHFRPIHFSTTDTDCSDIGSEAAAKRKADQLQREQQLEKNLFVQADDGVLYLRSVPDGQPSEGYLVYRKRAAHRHTRRRHAPRHFRKRKITKNRSCGEIGEGSFLDDDHSCESLDSDEPSSSSSLDGPLIMPNLFLPKFKLRSEFEKHCQTDACVLEKDNHITVENMQSVATFVHVTNISKCDTWPAKSLLKRSFGNIGEKARNQKSGRNITGTTVKENKRGASTLETWSCHTDEGELPKYRRCNRECLCCPHSSCKILGNLETGNGRESIKEGKKTPRRQNIIDVTNNIVLWDPSKLESDLEGYEPEDEDSDSERDILKKRAELEKGFVVTTAGKAIRYWPHIDTNSEDGESSLQFLRDDIKQDEDELFAHLDSLRDVHFQSEYDVILVDDGDDDDDDEEPLSYALCMIDSPWDATQPHLGKERRRALPLPHLFTHEKPSLEEWPFDHLRQAWKSATVPGRQSGEKRKRCAPKRLDDGEDSFHELLIEDLDLFPDGLSGHSEDLCSSGDHSRLPPSSRAFVPKRAFPHLSESYLQSLESSQFPPYDDVDTELFLCEDIDPEWDLLLESDDNDGICYESFPNYIPDGGDSILSTSLPSLPLEKAIFSSQLEGEWKKKDNRLRLAQRQHAHRFRAPPERRPCSFFMEGHCRRSDCRFSHDLRSITCRFWVEGSCFKGDMCPFLHGYASSYSHRYSGVHPTNKPTSFSLESEADFPTLDSGTKTEAPSCRLISRSSTGKPRVTATKLALGRRSGGVIIVKGKRRKSKLRHRSASPLPPPPPTADNITHTKLLIGDSRLGSSVNPSGLFDFPPLGHHCSSSKAGNLPPKISSAIPIVGGGRYEDAPDRTRIPPLTPDNII